MTLEELKRELGSRIIEQIAARSNGEPEACRIRQETYREALRLVEQYAKPQEPFQYRLKVEVSGPTQLGIIVAETVTVYQDRNMAVAAFEEHAASAHSAELWEERLIRNETL